MKVQVVKQDGHYIIPELEQAAIEIESFYVEVDQNISAKLNKRATSDTITQLQALNQSLGGDDYLAFKLKHLPKYYSHKTTKTDDDMLAEALMEKYAK